MGNDFPVAVSQWWLNPLYRIGGPRSIQLAVNLQSRANTFP
jgi:hypothetical protein